MPASLKLRAAEVKGDIGYVHAADLGVVEECPEPVDARFREDEGVNLGIFGEPFNVVGGWQPESPEIAIIAVAQLCRPCLELGIRIRQRQLLLQIGRAHV